MNILFLSRAVLLTLVLACTLATPARAADNWPERPITLVVPFGAGGVTDLTARTVAKQLQARLRQPVVIENKPGAGGSIAASSVARAKPDGYTLMVITNGMVAVNPLIGNPAKPPPLFGRSQQAMAISRL